MKARLLAVSALVAVALAGCYREKREFQSPPETSPTDTARLSAVLPGASAAWKPGSQPSPDRSRYEENAYAVNQGKRLYRWYNCSGCHSNGGGGMGVPLMDEKWLYGHEPRAIYATIVEGRPNGMPSFRQKIPDSQVRQLAAYVRSMSGQLRKDVEPTRNDDMNARRSEQRTARETPRRSSPPPQ